MTSLGVPAGGERLAESRRILGIDPGSRLTGFGIIDFDANKSVHVVSGCLRITGKDIPARLDAIFTGITSIIADYAPQEFAIEEVFMHRNASSALKLGQARGAAIVAGMQCSLPVFEYSPNLIKQSVTGKGHAAKEQVQHMVKILLTLPETPQSDAADALAVAICHGHIQETQRRLAVPAARRMREAKL